MKTTRRGFLRSLFFAPGGAAPRPTLVSIFLRGGADGLNMIIPCFEKRYYELRPTLSIAKSDCIDLDGKFRFHPGFKSLVPLFREERLAMIHAVGSDDSTRSHFEAQDLMDRGAAGGEGISGGWIGRHLRSRKGPLTSLSAVAISTQVPESLRSGPAAVIGSLNELEFRAGTDKTEKVHASLKSLYGNAQDAVSSAGMEALEVVNRLRGIRAKMDGYPGSAFATSLSQIAALIRADVGMEAACIDLGGWDTHYIQGTTSGLHAGLIQELSDGLAAFCRDLGKSLDRTIIVVKTEFGRRVYENGSLGTDHGRGSVMFLLGGAVRGGRVVTSWPGLEKNSVEGPGDLAVTTDYRDVLSEVIRERLGNPNLEQVFPGYRPKRLGLFR